MMKRNRRDWSIRAGSLALVTILQAPGALDGADVAPRASAPDSRPGPRYSRSVAAYEIPDVKLVDQDGRAVPFRDFLDANAPVALNFFFASCGSICPVMTQTFSRMRKELGKEGTALRMVSITIDPDQDSPGVLKSYAGKFSAGPGWSFLTGEAENVSLVQRSFLADSGGKFNHRPLFFFRGAGEKSWVRVEGLATASDLANEVRGLGSVLQAKQ